MNCISAIGRMPMRAAPMAAPTMADSLIGVSMTRSAPKVSRKPCGDPEGAAVGPDVLADHEHPRVALHLLEHGQADGFEIGEDGHQRVSRALSHSRDEGRRAGGHRRGRRRRRRGRLVRPGRGSPRRRPGRRRAAASISADDARRARSRVASAAGRERASRSGAMGSCCAHSSSSSGGTYFMSSCSAWPRMRMVSASMRVGPSPRARALHGLARDLVDREHVVAVHLRAVAAVGLAPGPRSGCSRSACRWASSRRTCCSRR